MMIVSANTAAIRITELKAAIAAMVGDRQELSTDIVGSMMQEIALLESQIESAFRQPVDADSTMAKPIAPNI